MSIEPFEANQQPGVAKRAAVDRLSVTIHDGQRSGTVLSAVAAITREAPLAGLFVAFLFGIAVARRR